MKGNISWTTKWILTKYVSNWLFHVITQIRCDKALRRILFKIKCVEAEGAWDVFPFTFMNRPSKTGSFLVWLLLRKDQYIQYLLILITFCPKAIYMSLAWSEILEQQIVVDQLVANLFGTGDSSLNSSIFHISLFQRGRHIYMTMRHALAW